MQEYIKMNGIIIKQPNEKMSYNFATTYSEDSTRTQLGTGQFTPLFTVEQWGYAATGLTVAEMRTILQIVAKGKNFTLHYFSPYYGEWRDDTFYVGQGSLSVQSLREDSEYYDTISFNMQVNPIK